MEIISTWKKNWSDQLGRQPLADHKQRTVDMVLRSHRVTVRYQRSKLDINQLNGFRRGYLISDYKLGSHVGSSVLQKK